MSLATFYLYKVDQCARLAEDAEPSQRCRFESERREWLRILAREIGVTANIEALEAIITRLPMDDADASHLEDTNF
jgi:hypothetical protein